VFETAPGAAGGAVGALEAGDRSLDAGAEAAQAAVDPRALDHVGNGDAALLVKGDVTDAAGLGGDEIGAAGIGPIGGGLPRRRAAAGDVAIEHRQEALGVGGIAGFDDDIEDQPAPAGRQIELVAVLNLTTALDDDVGVRLEQADQFLARRHRLAIEHAALGLGDEARDQRQIMVDLSTPALDGRLGALRQPGGDCLQFGPAGLGSGDQLAIPYKRDFSLADPWPSRSAAAMTNQGEMRCNAAGSRR
jgi:hypothetical protein